MECKRLKEFPHYKIYENGEVWRMAHRSTCGINLKTMKLRAYKTKNNYLMVSLHDREGKRKRFYLHRLVYMAFFGEIPKGMECDHINMTEPIAASLTFDWRATLTTARIPTALRNTRLQMR